MAKPKRATAKPFDRWIKYLLEEPAESIGTKLSRTDATLAKVFDVVKSDARVLSFCEALVDGNTSFSVFDLEVYPEMLLRGRAKEAWNEGGKVVGTDDVCLARNGGGDIYVWNAKKKSVRFLVHDEAWRVSRTYDSIDDFTFELMDKIVELAGMDQVDDADEAYIARLRFAISIAGDESLDDDVREKLEEDD